MLIRTHRAYPPVVVSLTLLASLLAAAGCNKKEASSPPGAAPAGGATLIASGKTVFETSRCTGCHSVGGQGGHRGPDLSHVGADPRHTPQWLAAYVKNPQQVNPRSRMPPFGSRLSDSDLNALGAYLASLK